VLVDKNICQESLQVIYFTLLSFCQIYQIAVNKAIKKIKLGSQAPPRLHKHSENRSVDNFYYFQNRLSTYEFWTFAYFDRLCKLEKRGDEIKKNSSPLKLLEQFWPFEEISIFSHGGHLGYRTVLTDTLFKGDHPRIISAKFGWDWHRKCPNLSCISIMMSFLTYITGFFMNFELLPILTDYAN
jgi:hypothetical protein